MSRPTLPGLEAIEITTPEDFADSMAGDLELQPIELDAQQKQLQRAGFTTKPSERAEARMSEAAHFALRTEANSTTTDNLGFRS